MPLLLAWLLAPAVVTPHQTGTPSNLSLPVYPTERLTNLRAKMRDGTILVADAVRPRGRGRFPVILERTPDGREAALARAQGWAARGYVYVAQDCRGRGRSGGTWTPFRQEGPDGTDTIAWIARQPWCDGNVAMIGDGYAASAQWAAAAERPPALRCIVPQSALPDETDGSADDRLAGADVPALHVSDARDEHGVGTRIAWEAMRRAGRKDQWRVLGPGASDGAPERFEGFDLDGLTLRFFDTYLKGRSVGMEDVPRVQAFVTGADRWLALDGWPASNAPLETRYLAPGALTQSPGRAGAAVYTYDPARDRGKPSASAGMALPRRGAYALFKGEPLPAATAVAGPFEVRLFFKSGAQDTDLFATLIDLAPNGSMRAIGAPGRLRASDRDGRSNPTLLKPGRIYAALIRPPDAAHEMAKGHRLALLVASSTGRANDRNSVVGPESDPTTVPQRNAILTGTITPSRITYRRLW